MRIQDVVLLVKDIHDNIPSLSVPVSVQAIKSQLTTRYGFQFELFHKASWHPGNFAGRLYRYQRDGRWIAQIVISEDLNFCWSRYVACKELAHLLIDRPDRDFADSPITIIRSLVDDIISIDEEISSEKCAMIAAIELLIPWRMHDQFLKMSTGGLNNYEIAVLLKVPEKSSGNMDFSELPKANE